MTSFPGSDGLASPGQTPGDGDAEPPAQRQRSAAAADRVVGPTDSTAEMFDERVAPGARFLDEPEFQSLLPRIEAQAGQQLPESPELAHLMAEIYDERSADAAEATGRLQFGRFQLLREVGSGAFGIVYLARDHVLHREVALKLPRFDVRESQRASDRFVRETRAASGLNHPNIVPVYDAGQRNGAIYIATQFVRGPSLMQWLDQAREPVAPRVAASLIAELADGVQHAHEARIVHRDIKPSNILLEPRSMSDTHSPDGLAPLTYYSAKLTDFGVAKFLDQQVDRTRTGDLLGTFRYMAPEQAMGRVNDIGPATDIYALGAVLYQLLTLHVPLAGENDAETLRNICEREPTPPRRMVASIPRDLEAICIKCLEKSPARRYADATVLRNDLRQFLAGEPTQARPVSAIERSARWIVRHPLVAGFWGLVFLLLAVLVVGFAWHSHRLGLALAETQVERERAEAGQLRTEQLLYVADMRLAFQAWHSSDLKTLKRQLQKWVPAAGQIDRRGFEWGFLQRVFERPVVRVEGHTGAIYSSDVSPDERMLATVGADGVARLWELDSQRMLGELVGHEGEINDVAFSADGRALATTSDDGTARLWNVDACQIIATLLGHEGSVYGVAFSPDGRWLATGGRDQTIQLWTAAGEPAGSLPVKGVVDHLAFSPDSQLLACTVDRAVQLWDIEKRIRQASIKLSDHPVSKSAFSPDGRTLAVASHDRNVYLWDLASGQLGDVLVGQGDWNLDVEFSAAGDRIAACNKDGSIRIWEIDPAAEAPARVRDGQAPVIIETNGQRAWSCGFTEQGASLVSTAHDGAFHIWPLHDLQGQWLLKRQSLPGPVVALSRDAKTVAVASHKRLSCWSVSSRERLQETRITEGNISCLAAGPDNWWCAGDTAGNVRLWQVSLDGLQRTFTGHTSALAAVKLSRSGHRLASVSIDGRLRVWTTDSGELISESMLSGTPPFMLAFAPQDDLVIANGQHLLICDPETLTERNRFESAGGNALAIAFSPDGQLMASGHTDNGIRLWSLLDGRLLGELLGHERYVTSLSFAANGQTLISSSFDGTLQAWHVPTGQSLGALLADVQTHVLSHDLAGDMSCLLATVQHPDRSVSVWMHCPHE